MPRYHERKAIVTHNGRQSACRETTQGIGLKLFHVEVHHCVVHVRDTGEPVALAMEL